MNNLANLLPLILLVLAFYLLILRPARNRQRAAQAVQEALRPGQQVLTTAGLYATVAAVEDQSVLLEVAPGVTCRYARPAVARIITGPDAGDAAGAQGGVTDEE